MQNTSASARIKWPLNESSLRISDRYSRVNFDAGYLPRNTTSDHKTWQSNQWFCVRSRGRQHVDMLTVWLIRMANSQLFGMPGQANHLYQAISVIGIMQLHDIMLSSLCIHTFSAMPEQALYQKTFWHYCIQCGIAAWTIVKHCSVKGCNHFSTLGLMQEVGYAFLAVAGVLASDSGISSGAQ